MIELSEKLRYIPGLVRGLQQTALSGHIETRIDADAPIEQAFDGIEHHLPDFRPDSCKGDGLEWLLGTLFEAAEALYRSNNLACSSRFSLTRVTKPESDSESFEFFIPLPVPPETARKCLQWLFDFVECNLSGDCAGTGVQEEFKLRLDSLLADINRERTSTAALQAVAMAAFEANIPITSIKPGVYSLGQGANARLVEGSLSVLTPAISTNLISNWFHTAELLRTLGLPVPRHLVVSSKEAALTVAIQMGFPVAIRPAKQGNTTYTNLTDPDGVAEAYEKAREHSDEILLEQYNGGACFRLTVFHGTVIKVTKLGPDEFTDNGSQLPREMIEQILPATDVHGDNQKLAINVANRLRLDIAGIDLAIPDIKQSWHSQNAVICGIDCDLPVEIQTAPQYFVQTVERLVPKGGRIPLYLAIWDEDFDAPETDLQELLKSLSCHALASKAGVYVDGTLTTGLFSNCYAAAKAMLLNNEVRSGMCLYDSHDLLLYGLPSDHFDAVYILYRDTQGRTINTDLQNAVNLLPPGLHREYFEVGQFSAITGTRRLLA